MTTLEMDAQRVMLAREILNTNNDELLSEMCKAYKRIKNRLAKAVMTKAKAETESKEYVLNSIKEAYLDVKYKRVEARPIDELFKELEAEGA